MADPAAHPYGLGWHPDFADRARRTIAAQGIRLYRVAAAAKVDIPPAWSLSAFRLRHMEQGQAGTCFPPGTHVRMADGSERKIEDVWRGEEVLTAEGNVGVVGAVMTRHHAGPVVALKLWGHSHLRMTPEHPVLTGRGYVAAGDLRLDDWVALPRYMPARTTSVVVGRHVAARPEPGPRAAGGLFVHVETVPRTIRLTPGAGRIFGLYLAEGSTDSHRIEWTFSLKERETLAAELIRLLASEWGVEPSVQVDEDHHVTRVRLYGSRWARLFESLCSRLSGRLRLHADLAGGPREFLENVLSAWLDGDGSDHGGGVRGVTISHELALGMYDIAQALGLKPSILKCRPAHNRHAKVRQPRWEVCLTSRGENYRVKEDDRHVWRKVRGIVLEDYDGPVFNLAVEGDNSYVSEGVGIHNCWVHAPTQLAETFAMAHGYPAFPICRRLVAWKGSQLEGGGNPSNGGDPTDAILAMTEGKGVGIGHEALCPYSDDYRVLGSRPPAPVFDDAKSVHIAAPIEVQSDDDARALIANGSAVANGIFWIFSWDQVGACLIDYVGRGTYGHALAEIGYVTKGVWPGSPGQYDWFQLDNWHGLLYKPLPPELAALVPNYKPIQEDKTSDFWVRADVYAKVRGYGNAIRCSATDMDGLQRIADLGDALSDFG